MGFLFFFPCLPLLFLLFIVPLCSYFLCTLSLFCSPSLLTVLSIYLFLHFSISLSFPSLLPLLHPCLQLPQFRTSLLSPSTFFLHQVVPIVGVVVAIVVVVVIVMVVEVVKNLLHFAHSITVQSKTFVYETLGFRHLGVHLHKRCINCSLLIQPIPLHPKACLFDAGIVYVVAGREAVGNLTEGEGGSTLLQQAAHLHLPPVPVIVGYHKA